MYMNEKETMALTLEQNNRLLEQNKQLQKENRELREELRRKTAECEELKKASFVLAEGLNFRQKLLDEIEKEINEGCKNCVAWKCEDCTCKNLLGIINKAKGGEITNQTICHPEHKMSS